MRKSGLQKQIASIFDDVPMPKTNPASELLPVQQQTTGVVNPKPVQNGLAQPPVSADTQKKPSLVQRMTAVHADAAHTPAVSALRPRPLPKTRITAAQSQSSQSIGLRLKKALSGSSKGALDARQKKAAVLVGILSLVFAGVLVVSLGGLGHSDAKAASATTSSSVSSTQAAQPKPLQWEKPQPLPAEMRNPMSPQAIARTGPDANSDQTGPMAVKGIVFSKNNPSAIIDSRVVREGEIIDGITIVKINKDSVEFQMGDKHWTQQVQR